MSARRYRPGQLHARPRQLVIAAMALPHLARTMPRAVLAAGCLAGLGISLAAHLLSRAYEQPGLVLLVQRAAFVPVIAGLAFLAADLHRSLITALPAPGWLAIAGRVVLALPAVGLAVFLQLAVAAADLAAAQRANPSAAVPLPVMALVGEFAAWSAVALAVAALVARSRWSDVGGAVAAPAALTLIAVLAAVPLHLLPTALAGTAAQRSAWLHSGWAWWAIALAGAVLAGWASRDPWHRLGFRPTRPAPG